MNYALGHAFKLKDLFMNFPIKKFKMKPKKIVKVYSDGNKRDFAAGIFADSLELVINDIIDNNVHFKLPTLGRTQAYMYMKRTSGDRFKRAFRRGKWRDVDFVTSNFSGYQIVLSMESKKRTPRTKLIYLAPKLKQKITDAIFLTNFNIKG